MPAQVSSEKQAALREVVWKDPGRMSGTPCFRGTRVPVKNLTDYLKAGYTLKGFLAGFPSVEREQAEQFLDLAAQMAGSVPVEPSDEARERNRQQPA